MEEKEALEIGLSSMTALPRQYHPAMEHKTRFFTEVNRCSVVHTELDNPFKDMVMYDLEDVDIKPLDLSKIPPEARPYPNCLFVSRKLLDWKK